jgi:hypothetical protein
MKKNHSFTAALAVTTIASSLVFSSLSASAEGCNFLKGKNATQAANGISPSSLVSSNQINPSGNQWGIWGLGAAIATGLFATGMALKYAIKRRQAEVVAETAISEIEFPEVSSFAIVVPPEALVAADETEADLTSVS